MPPSPPTTGSCRARGLRGAGIGLGVLAAALAFGCRDRTLTLADFSASARLTPPAAGAAVVGLVFETELEATAPVRLDVGCDGAVLASLTIPNGRPSRQRIDWYSGCAELSFAQGSVRPESIRIRYRFQTL